MSLGGFLFGHDGTSAANTLQPAINNAAQYTGQFGTAGQGANDAMATGSTTGSQYATGQVTNNPVLSGLFGKGGALNQSEDLNRSLNSTGYQLTSQDQDALGQVSGNIARQSGAQDQGLATSLAARGFGGASSGAAGAAFSGSAGNKFEQLAQAQTQIAQQRINNTQNRIAQNNQLMSSLGGQAEGAINDQYGRQIQGANFDAKQTQQGVDNAAAGQNETNEQFAQEQQTKSNGFLANAAGALVGGIGGGFGGALGGSLGKSLFGAAAKPAGTPNAGGGLS